MKKIIILSLTILCSFVSFSQDDDDDDDYYGNTVKDNYTPAEIQKILVGVPYKNHENWMKNEGYTYNNSKSTDKYFYYEKNDIIRFVLYYSNNKIHKVLALGSPQKFYHALAEIKEDGLYRLIEEKVGDIGKGKFMKEATWIRNGYVYIASAEDYVITVQQDTEGLASKPTIKSFER